MTGAGPSRGSAPWVWSPRKEKAALLLAHGAFLVDVYRQVPCTANTLTKWRKYPEFQSRVAEQKALYLDELHKRGILAREKRLLEYEDMHQRLRQVIEERARAYDGDAPGGGTGIVVRRTKSIGFGRAAQVVEEWEVDTALLREKRALMEQVAKERGEWAEKREVTGADAGPVQVEYVTNWRGEPLTGDGADADDDADDDADEDTLTDVGTSHGAADSG